jgi:hypothetical protein
VIEPTPKSNYGRDGSERPHPSAHDPDLAMDRAQFISLKATMGHVISDFRTGNFLSTSKPETPGLLKQGQTVRVVFLDDIDSFAFVPARYDKGLVDFFRNIPNRHFVKTDGVQYQRNRYAPYYKGAWVVPTAIKLRDCGKNIKNINI